MNHSAKNFKVYKSSAGSGKTTTLVSEYLSIALPRPDSFGNILAITFTVDATNEMKNRILSALESISRGDLTSDTVVRLTFERLKKQYGYGEQEFKDRADRLLKNILHSYSNFAISTIDSFVVKIVKAFAFDLQLPLNFDIELDTEVLIDEAVSALVAQAGYNEKLTGYLLRYLLFQAAEERETRIQKLLSNLAAKVLFNDSFYDFRSSLNKTDTSDLYAFSETVIKRFTILSERLKSLANQALELISSRNLEFKHFYRGDSGLPKYFTYVAALNLEKLKPKSHALETVNDDKWFGGKANKDTVIQNKILEIKDELVEIFKTIQLLLPEFLSFYLLRKNLESVVLLGSINEELNNFYRENSVIHLSETVRKVAAVVESEEMPFIYERIGNKYRHYLIDEFQDTSIIQWRNLVPLIENSLAEGHFNLIVGDGKQSIYRWRGGDFEQFVNLPQLKGSDKDSLLKTREETLQRNFDEVVLDKNFRSAKAIVEFNNALFAFLLKGGNPIIGEVFAKHRQKAFRKEEGYVELLFLPPRKEDEEAVSAKIINAVNDLLSRNYSFGDITVLARVNRSLEYVAGILLDAGIPIVSGQSLRLDASADVLFILNFIRWLQNPDDEISKTAVLFHLSSLDKGVPNLDGVMSPGELLALYGASEATRKNVSGSNDVADIIETTATVFDIYKRSYAYIIKLLEFANEAETSAGGGNVAFLDYCERYLDKQHISMPDNMDAVRLMTIHKSKGLEFPAVIFYDPVTGGNHTGYLTVKLDKAGIEKPEYSLIDDNKSVSSSLFADYKNHSELLSQADETNVLYVAATRAADELYIMTEKKAPYFAGFESFVKSGELEMEEEVEMFGESEISVYSSGQKPVKEKKEPAAPAEQLHNTRFKQWEERLSLRKYLKTAGSLEREDAVGEGIKIHAVLSEIESKKDVEQVLNNALIRGEIKESELERYRAFVAKVVEHPALESYFAEGVEVLNERSIISASGERYRPDRVVLTNDNITVIDYKYSGNPDERYLSQVRNYMRLVSEINPDKKVFGKILWLKDELIIQEVAF